MGVAGYLGAFTYCIRGGVFCNAQTANFVLFAMAIGRLDLKAAAYLLIPISSYFIGTVISERLRISVKTVGPLRWDTVLVGIEVIVTFAPVSYTHLDVYKRQAKARFHSCGGCGYNKGAGV